MDPQCHSLSLSFDLRIIMARNINLKSSGELFVRSYISAGHNRRVRLDSQQISSRSDPVWNQTFSLDCSGAQDSIQRLKQGTIVFELRLRRSAPFIGRMINMSGSKLLARAEMSLNDVVEAPNMEMEKWVVMIPKIGRVNDDDDVKPPAVRVAMRVGEYSAEVLERKKISERRRWSECDCVDSGCKSCLEYEFFAIGAALEAF